MTREEGGGSEIAALGFGKQDKLRSRKEIDRVFDEGRRYSCRGMRIHVAPNGLARNRAVFITVRSYPGAVERNRARRVLRECWRLMKAELSGGYDVAVILFPGADDFGPRQAQLRQLLVQAGLFRRSA